jgi:hypothetical protein
MGRPYGGVQPQEDENIDAANNKKLRMETDNDSDDPLRLLQLH